MSDTIYTVAVLTAKEGRLGDLKNALAALAAATRQEVGAVDYFFVQDEQHDPNTLVSIEKWRDGEAEKAHWQTPHLKQAIGQFKDILASTPIVHRGPRVI